MFFSVKRVTDSIQLYKYRGYSIGPRKFSHKDIELIKANRINGDYNIPTHIEDKIGANLHCRLGHPLNTTSNLIYEYFKVSYIENQRVKMSKLDPPIKTDIKANLWDQISPIVTTKQNFDDLLVPKEHVSRKATDTYYLNDKQLLRCHTSAHQIELMKLNDPFFLISADVYRRDKIDTTHFPIFHQMEGVRIFDQHPMITSEFVIQDLKEALEGMVRSLFGDIPIRWVEAYFPFTDPSYEMEIFFNFEWLEVLGCGAIHHKILENSNHENQNGWAFGLGLERLAMILFNIKDIRLFWSTDPRFIMQFSPNIVNKFKPFSNQPACYKDITFWIPENFHENEFYEFVRSIAGDIVEDVKLIDEFVHPDTKKKSHCYRINYRAMDRTLTNEEIDTIQQKIRNEVANLAVELR